MKLWTLLAALAIVTGCSNAPAGTRPPSPDASMAAALPPPPAAPAAPAAAPAAPDAGTPGVLPTAEKMRALTDPAAKAIIDGEWTPGLIVALIDENGDTFLKYGVASTGGPPVDEDTIFEIGSVTKVFTSIALAQLVGEGKVKLDEPVADLLPPGTKVPARGDKKITVEQLATHRSGLLRVPGDLDALNDPYAQYDAKKLYTYLAHASLQTAPGEAFEYSNTGGGLLGFALSLRAKTPFARLVIDGIARPLGLKSTFIDVPKAAKAHLAQGYTDGEPVSAWHFDALAGAGAMRSSARDLARFVRAQLGFLPEKEVPAALRTALALTREPRAGGMGQGKVALAWFITPDGTRWWHNGATGGFRSWVSFDPVRKRGMVVLANSSDEHFESLALHLAQAWSAAPAAPMKLRPTAAIDPAKLDDYVGVYPITAQYIMKLTRVGNHLRLDAPGQKPMTLWPSAPDKFYMRVIDAKAEFERDSSGKVVAMLVEQDGKQQRAPRGVPGEKLPEPPVAVPPNPHGGIANPGPIK
jgi:D-alanyl-D-alanine-carboxypeptidase/D-alanyl-D-alanine-endopeptidase